MWMSDIRRRWREVVRRADSQEQGAMLASPGCGCDVLSELERGGGRVSSSQTETTDSPKTPILKIDSNIKERHNSNSSFSTYSNFPSF